MYPNILNQYSNKFCEFLDNRSDFLMPKIIKTGDSYRTSAGYILDRPHITFTCESLVDNSYTDLNLLNDFITNNYADSGLLDDYYLIKKYENQYSKSSEDLLNSWKENNLSIRNSDINEWLETYLQIRPFINNDTARNTEKS